jgi:hypothetical protein
MLPRTHNTASTPVAATDLRTAAHSRPQSINTRYDERALLQHRPPRPRLSRKNLFRWKIRTLKKLLVLSAEWNECACPKSSNFLFLMRTNCSLSECVVALLSPRLPSRMSPLTCSSLLLLTRRRIPSHPLLFLQRRGCRQSAHLLSAAVGWRPYLSVSAGA